LRQRFAAVGDQGSVRVDVAAELPQHAQELWPTFALVRERRDIVSVITMESKNGTVVLNDHVHSWTEKEDAIRAA
jgi:hypothetical protein